MIMAEYLLHFNKQSNLLHYEHLLFSVFAIYFSITSNSCTPGRKIQPHTCVACANFNSQARQAIEEMGSLALQCTHLFFSRNVYSKSKQESY
mgnify:CR=1 FL=1